MIVHDFAPGYGPAAASVAVGFGIEALFYADGTVRIAHDCKLIGPDRRVRTAPLLQLGNGHTITALSPLTITPSILCDDCGLHGYITECEWVPC
jgi:hypothetical protein